MYLTALRFERKVHNTIRMVIAILKLFIWGGIPIRRIVGFGNHVLRLRSRLAVKNSDLISDDIPPQKKILNTDISKCLVFPFCCNGHQNLALIRNL